MGGGSLTIKVTPAVGWAGRHLLGFTRASSVALGLCNECMLGTGKGCEVSDYVND